MNHTTNISSSLAEFFYIVSVIQATISLIGVVSNLLNIYVLVNLVRRRKGVSPTYHLLIAMGVADLSALFVVGFYYMNTYTSTPPLLHPDLSDEHHDFHHLLLNMWFFFVNPFSLASNWLVVATTIFRFLAVAFPMKACQWCTLFRMRISILLIFLLAVCMNLPDWFTITIYQRTDGRIRVNETSLYNDLVPYYYFYHIVEVHIPFTLNLMLVIFLIINLKKTRSSMAKCMQDESQAAREKEHRRIGIMLVAIVLWFLLCNIAQIIYQLMRDTSSMPRANYEQLPHITKFSVLKDTGPLLNHAGNIFFYCLCNSTYRRMFINTLLCRKQLGRQSQATQSTQVSTRHEYVSRLRESRKPLTGTNYSRQNRLSIPGETSPFLDSDSRDGTRASVSSYNSNKSCSRVSEADSGRPDSAEEQSVM